MIFLCVCNVFCKCSVLLDCSMSVWVMLLCKPSDLLDCQRKVPGASWLEVFWNAYLSKTSHIYMCLGKGETAPASRGMLWPFRVARFFGGGFCPGKVKIDPDDLMVKEFEMRTMDGHFVQSNWVSQSHGAQ